MTTVTNKSPSSTPIAAQKPTLAWAAATLAHVVAVLEDEQPVDDALRPLYDESLKLTHEDELANVVDRYIFAEHHLKAILSATKQKRDEWITSVKRLESAHGRFKEYIKSIILRHSHLAFRGNEGEIRLQANGGDASLEVDIKTTTRSIAHIVSQSALDEFNLPVQYRRLEQFYTLNAEQIRADLRSGKEMTWARLSRGSHVTFKSKKSLPRGE